MSAVVASLVAGTALAHASTAYAGTPVTTPDTVTVTAGGGTLANLVANDSDPDGDELVVCRVADVPRDLDVELGEGRVAIAASPDARGSYTFTYYACDYSTLTPGTVTVVIHGKAPSVTFHVLARPGRVRIVNTYPHTSFHCQWHGQGPEALDGKAVLKPRSSIVAVVRHTSEELECDAEHDGYGALITGIKLPGGRRPGRCEPPAAGRVPGRVVDGSSALSGCLAARG